MSDYSSGEESDHYDLLKSHVKPKHNLRPGEYSSKQLNKAATKILDNISKLNNPGNDIVIDAAKTYNTISVGQREDGKIIVAANIQKCKNERSQKNPKTQREIHKEVRKLKVENVGLQRDYEPVIFQTLKDTLGKDVVLSTPRIVETQKKHDNSNEPMKKQRKDNRKPHAEMQLISDANKKDLALNKVGISKKPCQGCNQELSANGVGHGYDDIGNKFDNWEKHKDIKTKNW